MNNLQDTKGLMNLAALSEQQPIDVSPDINIEGNTDPATPSVDSTSVDEPILPSADISNATLDDMVLSAEAVNLVSTRRNVVSKTRLVSI